ncbi:MAG TPA: C1 family peptidase [Burkholderiales bacterium]|jgi:C1A family cysteine protease|nr:C1 family peptidase [Burkholderiales bacterium]
MAYTVKRYGWIPDVPDQRDHLYAAPIARLRAFPPKTDLRRQCPAVYDQGELGSCTGNAIAGAVQFDRRKLKRRPDFVPSRLFIYYNERVIEHTVESDSGAQIRDGIKSVAKLGVCPETEWPYDIAKFAVKPPATCYRHAKKYRAIGYQRVVQSLAQMKGCLASGYPFVFGFTVYESFESDQVARTGVVPMPAAAEKVLGGHAVLAVGYDDTAQRFIVRNSWGRRWGIAGYFTMPYAYLADDNLAADFWTIRVTSG